MVSPGVVVRAGMVPIPILRLSRVVAVVDFFDHRGRRRGSRGRCRLLASGEHQP